MAEPPRRSLLYIEHESTLYRGFGRSYPSLVWCSKARSWALYPDPVPRPQEWGHLVCSDDAEWLYPGSTTTPPPAGVETERTFATFAELLRMRPELFDHYDVPVVRRSPVSEARKRYLEATMPDHVKNAIAKREDGSSR